MKAIGVVRKIDNLGRIVLPSELRTTMGLTEGASFELFTDDNTVILKKYEPGCIFTGSMDDLIEFEGRKVSKEAIKKMAEIAGLI